MVLQLDPGREPIAGYRLVRQLGQGGFGEVWEAIAPGDVPVALKFIRLGTAQAAPELRALDVVKRIRHPNLLDIQFAAQVEDRLIIAMPLCEGSLLDRLRECQENGLAGIPFDELADYMRDTARALDYLNEPCHPTADGRLVSVAHRDVKPHNIFRVGGSVRVADFGLVKALETSVASHTGSMTPAYAAPEILAQTVSPRSDQWSLAVTYYQLRTGRLPFEGTIHSMMLAIVQNPPNLIGLAAGERAVLERALSKHPDDRWPSCRDFVTALGRAVPAGAGVVDSGGSPPTDSFDYLDSSLPAPAEARDVASLETDDSSSRYSTEKTPLAAAPVGRLPRFLTPSSNNSIAARRPLAVRVVAGILLCGLVVGLGYAIVSGMTGTKDEPVAVAGGDSPTPAVDESSQEIAPSPPTPKVNESKTSPDVAAPNPAIVRVLVTPPDAKIEVVEGKGKIAGAGGERRIELPAELASYSIVASKTGYVSEEWKVTVAPGEAKTIEFHLAALAAVLSVSVTPAEATLAIVKGAAEIRPVTPSYEVRVTKPDGKATVTIEASHAGYEDSRFDWIPQPGETKRREIQLSPRPAVLSLEVSPPEVELVADGQTITDNAGPTRTIEVGRPTGKEELRVTASLDGYRSSSISWVPAPGEIVSKRIILKRNAPPALAKEIKNSVGMTLVLIPKGGFEMGSPEEEEGRDADEGPVHTVEITKPFYMGQCEVTKGQFEAFVKATGYQTEAESDGSGGWGWNETDGEYENSPAYSWRNTGFAQSDHHPVVNVTWSDAVAFCNWLSKRENLRLAYQLEQRTFLDRGGNARHEEVFVPIDGSNGYRLPTEAEWEYACRAGSTGRFFFGDDDEELARHGNIADASARARLKNYADWTYLKARDGQAFTAPVGLFPPNTFGLRDMHGNVWEWCNDWYAANYYAVSPTADPRCDSGQDRVLRGGGWYTAGSLSRSASRYAFGPHNREADLGFRVVRAP